MKKIMCNVLYKVSLPVHYSTIGKLTYELGIFEDEKLAKTCLGILERILYDLQKEKEEKIEYFGYSKIEALFIPEVRMKNPTIQSKLVKSLDEFIKINYQTNNYKLKRGEDKLQDIINKVNEHIAQTYIEDENIISE
ncbi:MAG: hypothetical protein IKC49_02495 [Clostridia bacterium]|nr:hypothetical protein [Clostridia bacterium]